MFQSPDLCYLGFLVINVRRSNVSEIIKHDQLKMLATNGGVQAITIIGQAEGFALSVTTLTGNKTLHAKTGQTRFFKKADSVLSYLKDDIGVGRASIQFESWNPKQATLK